MTFSVAPSIDIRIGHVLDELRKMPDKSVHCVVTSPPYWGLRDYSRCGCALRNIHHAPGGSPSSSGDSGADEGSGVKSKPPDPDCPNCHGTGKDESLEVVWDGKEGCEHEWSAEWPKVGRSAGATEKQLTNFGSYSQASSGRSCLKCGAWRGQLGLEPTPDLYVQHIVHVFREVRRVLRDDGTLWLNMGDCYAGSGTGQKENTGKAVFYVESDYGNRGQRTRIHGLKPKDLVGMPWRVAFALQADGWWLRRDIIWAKPNPMPESITDRPTKAHEYVFLLSKNVSYFYDADAVREPHSEGTVRRFGKNPEKSGGPKQDYSDGLIKPNAVAGRKGFIGSRNSRTVWTIPTQPYPEAHFATFPEKLVEPCIKAGTSEKGCCAICGAPWERVVEKAKAPDELRNRSPETKMSFKPTAVGGGQKLQDFYDANPPKTVGFRATCNHNDVPVPCVVLDPFAGSGTVGKVARDLGRSAILIEIKEQYAKLARKRCRTDLSSIDTFDPDTKLEGEP